MPMVGVGFVLVVLATMTLWKQRTTTPNESSAAGDDGATTGLERDTASRDVDMRGRGTAAASGTALSAEDAVKGILTEREQGRAEQTARSARYKGELVARYLAETTDPAWAGRAERTLQSVINDPAVQAAGLAAGDTVVDCKRTTCRTTAHFPNNGQADDWSMLYMASSGVVLRNSVVSSTQNADGSVSVDIYSTAK